MKYQLAEGIIHEEATHLQSEFVEEVVCQEFETGNDVRIGMSAGGCGEDDVKSRFGERWTLFYLLLMYADNRFEQ